MGSYEIEISRTAEKQLKKLPVDDQLRVVRAVLALVEEPHPRGSRNADLYPRQDLCGQPEPHGGECQASCRL